MIISVVKDLWKLARHDSTEGQPELLTGQSSENKVKKLDTLMATHSHVKVCINKKTRQKLQFFLELNIFYDSYVVALADRYEGFCVFYF